jgi:hypothetical protein
VNVRDQLQTRQDAANARRSTSSAAAGDPSPEATAPASTPGASGPATSAAAPGAVTLPRTSLGSRNGADSSFSRSNGVTATTAAEDAATTAAIPAAPPGGPTSTPFAAIASIAAEPYGGTGSPADGSAVLGVGSAVDAAGLSVKERVAAVEQRAKSGGGASDTLPVLPEVSDAVGPEARTSTAGRADQPAADAPAGAPPAAPPALSASRSFGSSRRLTGGLAVVSEGGQDQSATTAAASAGAAAAGELRPTSACSRPNSGTWPKVVITPPVLSPSSYPSTVAAAAAAGTRTSLGAATDDAGTASRTASFGGDTAAALAAADALAADAAAMLGSGDNSLQAAMANPAAAFAYLREHPETLRELWTLRGRVQAQEKDLADMVGVFLSTEPREGN